MKPFYLTYVLYKENDIISWLLSLFTLSPVYNNYNEIIKIYNGNVCNFNWF